MQWMNCEVHKMNSCDIFLVFCSIESGQHCCYDSGSKYWTIVIVKKICACTERWDSSQVLYRWDYCQCLHRWDSFQFLHRWDSSQCMHRWDSSQCLHIWDSSHCLHRWDSSQCLHRWDCYQCLHKCDLLPVSTTIWALSSLFWRESWYLNFINR